MLSQPKIAMHFHNTLLNNLYYTFIIQVTFLRTITTKRSYALSKKSRASYILVQLLSETCHCVIILLTHPFKLYAPQNTPMTLQYSSSESGKKLKFPNISVVALHYVHAKWRNTRYGYRPTLYGIHVRLHNNNAFHLF